MIREGKIIFALTSSYFSSRNIAFSYIFMTTIIIIENWLLSVQDLCAFCVFFVGIFVEQIEKTNDKKRDRTNGKRDTFKSIYYRLFQNLNHTPFKNVTITTRGCAKPPISSTHFSYLIF